MPWYKGPSLMEYLEHVQIQAAPRDRRIALAGAVGESPEPGFPRLLRSHRRRHRAPGRCRSCAAIGRANDGQSGDRMVSTKWSLRDAGDSVTLTLIGRGGRKPRRCAGDLPSAARGGGPVRGQAAVDDRTRHDARAPVPDEDRLQGGDGHHHRHQIPGGCEYRGAPGRENPGFE